MRIPTDEDLNNVITTYAGNEKFSWLADIARELQTTRAQLAEVNKHLEKSLNNVDYWRQLSSENKVAGMNWMEKADNFEKQLAEAQAEVKRLKDENADLNHRLMLHRRQSLP